MAIILGGRDVTDSQMLTSRQYIALHYYYVEGWSYRRIGDLFGSNPGTVFRLVTRGKNRVITYASDKGGNSLPLVKALTAPSPRSTDTRLVGVPASRREELLDALQLRLEQHAKELAIVEECMSGTSFSPTHIKRNHYTHWELNYLACHAGEPLPTSAYTAKNAARYCANDWRTCGLECAGCNRERRAEQAHQAAAAERV